MFRSSSLLPQPEVEPIIQGRNCALNVGVEAAEVTACAIHFAKTEVGAILQIVSFLLNLIKLSEALKKTN
jgi:hypothetical protein